MNDCELFGHPNVTGDGCPCGAVVTVPTPPAPWPRETPEMLMHLERAHQRPHRRRAVPTIPYRPRPSRVAPRVQRVVYP